MIAVDLPDLTALLLLRQMVAPAVLPEPQAVLVPLPEFALAPRLEVAVLQKEDIQAVFHQDQLAEVYYHLGIVQLEEHPVRISSDLDPRHYQQDIFVSVVVAVLKTQERHPHFVLVALTHPEMSQEQMSEALVVLVVVLPSKGFF
jgi:hypothetical protein